MAFAIQICKSFVAISPDILTHTRMSKIGRIDASLLATYVVHDKTQR